MAKIKITFYLPADPNGKLEEAIKEVQSERPDFQLSYKRESEGYDVQCIDEKSYQAAYLIGKTVEILDIP